MINNFTLACLLAVTSAFPGFAGSDTTTVAGLDNVTSFKLDNGMDVVVVEDHRAPVVTHMIWYRVGAADEKPGKSGIAHFLEHLLFKGTKSHPAGEFSEIIAANGGSQNAFTSYDYTAYYQRIAADRLPLMMELEADRIENLVLSDEDVLPERQVVLEERNSRTENNPDALYSEQARAALFLNHPYGVPIIGWKHEIAQLSLTDALDFYKTYYAPNNAILVVAGDVDPQEVKNLAQKYYGPLRPSENLPQRFRPSEPPHLAPIRIVYEDARIRQPYVYRTYVAPNRQSGNQKEAAAIGILAALLGGSGVTSILGEKLQLEQKIAVATGAFYNGDTLNPSTFGLYAVPIPGVSLKQTEAAIDEILAQFLEQGVDPDHLARIHTQIQAAEIYALDDLQGLARRYGEALTTGLTLQDVADWPTVLSKVTAQDVMAAAESVLDKKNSVTGWLRALDAEVTQ